MSGILMSRVLEELKDEHEEARSENYVMVNIRPGEKIAAMLDVMAYLTQKTPSAILGQALSQELADYAAAYPENHEAILDAVEEVGKEFENGFFIPEDCALGILKKRKILNVETEMERRFRRMLSTPEGAHAPKKEE